MNNETIDIHGFETYKSVELITTLTNRVKVVGCALVPFIESWAKTADYGQAPDTDGDTERTLRFRYRDWRYETIRGKPHECAEWSIVLNSFCYDISLAVAFEVTPSWKVYGR